MYNAWHWPDHTAWNGRPPTGTRQTYHWFVNSRTAAPTSPTAGGGGGLVLTLYVHYLLPNKSGVRAAAEHG